MRLAKTFLTVLLLSCFASTLRASDPLDGYWKAVFRSQGGEGARDYYFDISQDGKALRGRVISPRGGEYAIQRGENVDGRVTIVVEREYEGTPVVLTVKGERTKPGRVAGALIVADNEVATFVMERLGRPVGRWNVEAMSPDEDQVFKSTLTLRRAERGYAGAFASDLGELELAGCAWQDDRLVIDIKLPTNDGEVPIRIRAGFSGADTLEGEWQAESVGYAGKWRARRDVVYELTGLWKLRADSPEGTHEAEIEITRKGDAFVGRYKGPFGELVLNSVELDGNRVAIELNAPVEGETMTIALSGEFGAANSLAGKWQTRNAGYEGEWTAKKAAAKKPAPADEKRTKIRL